MYYFVFIILVFFSFWEVYTARRNKYVFVTVYFLLTCMLIFRYGQLADYFSYEMIYYSPELAGITDPLYFVITNFLVSLGISFIEYVIFVGLLTMWLAYPFFSTFCNKSITALMIFYTYAFLILPMNAFRQGFCLSLLLYCFTLILNKQKVKFYCVVLTASFIHVSMLSVLLIDLLYDKTFFNKWYISWILFVLTIFALITPDLTTLIPEALSGRSLGDYGESRLLQITIRALLICPVLWFKPCPNTLGYYAKSICIIGYAVYCLFAFAPTLSGRLEYYFRIYLCLFVSYVIFIEKSTSLNKIFMQGIILVHIVLFFKNINSFIIQGSYDTNKVSMLNFPYISIFDKDEIKKYQ